MEHPDQDPETTDTADAGDEAAIRREKFIAAMKGKRGHDTGPHGQELSNDDVRRRRADAPPKSKVRRRPRNV